MRIQRDSGWSWVVLTCVMCSQTMLGGVCLSGGIFYVIFTDAFGADPVEVSMLCSLPVTMWFLSTPLGSFLTNRYGYRACAFIGGIMAAAGLALSFFATSLTFLICSHGILTGLGFGVNYTGCMASLNVYFDKYKTIATGISSVGHNLGMILYAELIILLDENFGWRGMLLVLSAVTFNLCACASAMTPLSIFRNTDLDTDAQNHVSSTKQEIIIQKVKKKTLNTTVFRKLAFISFCASNVFNNLSQGIYILYLPSISKYAGFTLKDFSTLLIVYSVCNIIGKAFFSFLGHHPRVNCTVLYTVALTIAGVATGLTPSLLTKTGMFILAAIVGFFYCVAGALVHAVIHSIVGFDRFADGVGFSLPFKAAGNLIGSPIAGLMVASTGSYSSSFYIAGVSMVTSSLLMIYPIVHHKQRQKTHRNNNIYTVSEIKIEKPTEEEHSVEPLIDTSSKIIHKIRPVMKNGGSNVLLNTDGSNCHLGTDGGNCLLDTDRIDRSNSRLDTGESNCVGNTKEYRDSCATEYEALLCKDNTDSAVVTTEYDS